ncbi:unnamed protein product [Strongylus vulgaris]|uniref:Uncharacterized protein n=1 Tax=Strongylus vulgaris TaxID=40348 RepID=A0A3P7I5U2_STRVU|nr:unnamed protein product [Strongylus vulgaris]
MDRHRPPNFSFFELDSKRTLEISLHPSQLLAASRQLFFDQTAYAALKLTVIASLVSVLPRRRRQPPDPLIDPKSKQIHLTTGNVLLQAISSIERFVIKNMKKLVASVHIDPCDVEAEMKSLRCRLEATTNPWVELEDMAVSLSSRLSLLYNQLVRLCTASTAISSMLLQNYLRFREKMLAETFLFAENSSNDLSKYNSTDKIFSLISKSKYLEKLPRFSIFCPEVDSSYSNWCLIVEERFPIELNLALPAKKSSSDQKLNSLNVGPMGDSLPMLRHDPLRVNSRFSWWRRKSTNGPVTAKSSVQTDSCRSPISCSEEPLSTYTTEEDLSTVVDFVTERERLKSALCEQRLFEGYLYR